MDFSSSSSTVTTTVTTVAAATTVVSKCRVYPSQTSAMDDLKLSVSDLPMLSCHYIQKGVLLPQPPFPIQSLVSLLKLSLSLSLSLFPPLAGRLSTDSSGHFLISCNDEGVDLIHASAVDLLVADLLSPSRVPERFKSFFPMDRTVSYRGHWEPIVAVQVTELRDGVFIGCAANHAVVDGTSFWNFFNTFAEVSRIGERRFSKVPDFCRESVLISKAVLKIPEGGPRVTFDEDEPLSERIFSFSREAILRLKAKANDKKWSESDDGDFNAGEIMGKQMHDPHVTSSNEKLTPSFLQSWFAKPRGGTGTRVETVEISSFQALCALLWRSVTRARKLPSSKTTTFRMAVNCRHRLEPLLDAHYFGNAIQSTPTHAAAGEVLSRDLRWCAERLNRSVAAHGDAAVRGAVKEWEREPRLFPLGNADGASMTMGSSPRFPMYENDFGWGRPVAIRSGKANKFDGKISAFPGREGGGSVDLEVVLAPETMDGIECDSEFMQYASQC
ncbi:uncharacterized acetyltransferase At3g50280 [Rhodamnia argentea]|uniref:Uncharacterized acetyltransferase At3g50280 n=1 Tax=Rhodamnia argentea TaxID=178133 RepID=A0A8B8PZV2_9MYRT|nr:uncharacterized acetyltransferase At3g50280 [Rhodamnia argentea]